MNLGQYIVLESELVLGSPNTAYVCDLGQFDTIEDTTITIESEISTLPSPKKAGYQFMGWYNNAEFTGEKVTTIPAGTTGDIELHAYFVKVLELTDADEAVFASVTPTKFVNANFTEEDYLIQEEKYSYGTQLFKSIAAALAAAQESDVIYVFAGTYADALTISVANVSIIGPNYGISYDGIRTNESIINALISVSANGFTLNGVSVTGSAIKVTAAISNLTIKNNLISSTGVSTNGGRTGIIASDVAINGFVFNGNSVNCTGTAGKNAMAIYGALTNADIQNNSFNNGGTSHTNSEVIRANNVHGTFIYINNNSIWATSNYTLYIRPLMTTENVTITVQDNVFDGGTDIGSGFYFPNQSATSSVTFMGNELYNIGGNIFSFADCQTGSKQNIMYNYLDSKTAYKLSTKGSGTITYTNNYYAAAQTTTTSDYGVIASKDALDEAYAAYKASLLG